MVKVCPKCGYLQYSLHKNRKVFCKCQSEDIEKLIEDKLKDLS